MRNWKMGIGSSDVSLATFGKEGIYLGFRNVLK
jgi:hypothetical protein